MRLRNQRGVSRAEADDPGSRSPRRIRSNGVAGRDTAGRREGDHRRAGGLPPQYPESRPYGLDREHGKQPHRARVPARRRPERRADPREQRARASAIVPRECRRTTNRHDVDVEQPVHVLPRDAAAREPEERRRENHARFHPRPRRDASRARARRRGGRGVRRSGAADTDLRRSGAARGARYHVAAAPRSHPRPEPRRVRRRSRRGQTPLHRADARAVRNRPRHRGPDRRTAQRRSDPSARDRPRETRQFRGQNRLVRERRAERDDRRPSHDRRERRQPRWKT